MDGDGAVAGNHEASEGDSPAPVAVPKILFDFVTSDIGQFAGDWRDSSPELPPAASPKPDDGADVEATTSPRQAPDARFEVAIPEMPTEIRDEYATVYSDVVERIADAVGGRGQVQYSVEFTDGREDLVRHSNDLQFSSRISFQHRGSFAFGCCLGTAAWASESSRQLAGDSHFASCAAPPGQHTSLQVIRVCLPKP
jgi:hypothetical protein